jgi:hypothetical protein
LVPLIARSALLLLYLCVDFALSLQPVVEIASMLTAAGLVNLVGSSCDSRQPRLTPIRG